MAYKKNYTIDRKTWLRGEGSNESYLLRQADKKMCCLGQMLEQAGVAKKELARQQDPSDMNKCDFDKLLRNLLLDDEGDNSELAGRAMNINDSLRITEEMREARLAELFKYHDINLRFIN